MTYAIAYAAALIAFGIVDAVWLTMMGSVLYRPTLGDILIPTLRVAPAIVFYLLYPIGVTVFATMPALRSGSVMTAVSLGLLLGAVAYGTYDLSNFATLRNWTALITTVDIVYGAILTAAASVAAVYAVRLTTG